MAANLTDHVWSMGELLKFKGKKTLQLNWTTTENYQSKKIEI
jgi:hypothetical protein